VIAILQPKPIVIVVDGMPEPQGSKAARVVKGRAILTEGFGDGPRRRKAWREAVADAARLWLQHNGRPAPLDGPLRVTLEFRLSRPASAAKRVLFPMRKPDLSKLVRSAEDSLSGLIYTDDARIVEEFSSKRFALGEPPGATITVEIL